MYLCCYCGKEIYKPPMYKWCNKCWHDFEADILAHAAWTKYLQRLETNRRYKEKSMWERGIGEVYLGDDDLAQIGGVYKIIRKYKESEAS